MKSPTPIIPEPLANASGEVVQSSRFDSPMIDPQISQLPQISERRELLSNLCNL